MMRWLAYDYYIYLLQLHHTRTFPGLCYFGSIYTKTNLLFAPLEPSRQSKLEIKFAALMCRLA